MTDEQVAPGEPQQAAAPSGESTGSFGDAAAEMANETEVEASGAEAPAGDVPTDEQVLDADLTTAEVDAARARDDVAALTADLQRLQAEYANYKKRVDRDRDLVRENATYAALAPIIEVLDTIDRAREHGELEGGFKAVADQLERIVSNLGLTRFGQPGDAFDPNVHEALSHLGTDAEVSVTTCRHIAKAGYKINDRVVRAAQVLVVDPPEGDPADA